MPHLTLTNIELVEIKQWAQRLREVASRAKVDENSNTIRVMCPEKYASDLPQLFNGVQSAPEMIDKLLRHIHNISDHRSDPEMLDLSNKRIFIARRDLSNG
jgi:hypothetical protein